MRKIFIFTLILITSLNAQSYKSLKKIAYDAHKSGEYKSSIELTKRYIDSHPKSLKAKNLLAVLYYWSGDLSSSKTILEDILAKSDYDEAKKLLKIVNKKLKVKNVKSKNQKVANKSKKSLNQKPAVEITKLYVKRSKYKDNKKDDKQIYVSTKIDNKKEDIDDFDRLAAMIDLDSDDENSKELLSKYYYKMGEYQKSYDLAKEILYTDPDNKDMKEIVAHLSKRDDIKKHKRRVINAVVDLKKAKYKLKTLFKKRKYTEYINLYKALKGNGERMSKRENEDALFASIMIGDFKYAKKVLATSPLPHSRYKREVQTLLLEK